MTNPDMGSWQPSAVVSSGLLQGCTVPVKGMDRAAFSELPWWNSPGAGWTGLAGMHCPHLLSLSCSLGIKIAAPGP